MGKSEDARPRSLATRASGWVLLGIRTRTPVSVPAMRDAGCAGRAMGNSNGRTKNVVLLGIVITRPLNRFMRHDRFELRVLPCAWLIARAIRRLRGRSPSASHSLRHEVHDKSAVR
jgi:hypothetical protein